MRGTVRTVLVICTNCNYFRFNAGPEQVQTVKAEKYVITTEGTGEPIKIVRWGFGAAGEEIQKLLTDSAVTLVRIEVTGTIKAAVFGRDKEWRLLDIKQKIKSLTSVD